MTGFRTITIVLAALLLAGVEAFAVEPAMTSQSPMWYGAAAAKASGDTIDLMGPGGIYPYRGDFETANARPGGDGFLTDGWTSDDLTRPANHWHVDTYRNPFTGKAAWCGDIAIASCGAGDPVGGYNNNWRDILEFRKTVGAVPAIVRVRANLQYDTEPAYDFTTLQRRTAQNPNFEAVAGGQGLSWDGAGTTAVDYTFNYSPSELIQGTDIALAFIFDSDGAWSDGDCSWPTDGAARLDDIIVTLNGVDFAEDFEDGLLGPDWAATPNQGVGDFARVWQKLGDLDDCASNYSKMVAFIDDGLVVPGTGGWVGRPGMDYGPPGGWVVNPVGGMLGPLFHIANVITSPVMDWPAPAMGGLTFAFDVYRHELLIGGDTPSIFYTWSVRSTAGSNINAAPWVDRNFVYYGGPSWLRSVNVVDDLIVAGATQVQVQFGVVELGWQFCYGSACDGTNASPAPYFDNASIKVYPTSGARISVTEIRMANDVFPAIGDVDLANLGRNSCRFDMAANISLKTHSRNDPGDSIWIDVTPRAGGALSGPPVMGWQFAVKNPLFTDAMRTALAPGQTSGSVTGNVTRNSSNVVVANRYNFDLPDTGMLFPGDVLHYYFAATDAVGGDVRTAYAPLDRSGLGQSEPLRYPGLYTVNCLPSLRDAAGTQPTLLLWNDAGFRGGEDEWYAALRYLSLFRGSDYDVFTTHGPSSGVGNGLGGRATAAQVDGYHDMLYTCGDLGTLTLSNGDYNSDAGNDTGLLNSWFTLGNRDLFMTGDDLANALYQSGAANRTFLETKMGVTFIDGDVRDNIGGQTAPLVIRIPGNPVFATANSWIAYGGCASINDFDNVVPRGSATRLAQFTAPGGTSTPYAAAAAILNTDGTNRIVSLDHDFMFVVDPAKSPSPAPARVVLLDNVLGYFGVPVNVGMPVGGVVPGTKFSVQSYPNPFNPAVTLRYTLPAAGRVTMKVFDARGALVRTLLDEHVDHLNGVVTWDGRSDLGAGVAAGLYFVETRAGDQVDVRKVTMLK